MTWRRVKEFLLAAPEKAHAETLAESRQRWFENVMAVLLAVAAIIATWASFQASQWSGKAGELVSQASTVRADSNRWASRGVEQTLIDGTLWIEWEKAVILGRDDFAGFMRDRFSPALSEAQDSWFGRAVLDENGIPLNGKLPGGTPMGLDEYVPAGQAKSEELAALSESLLAQSEKFGGVSSKYILMTVVLALVLFFGSIANKFANPKVQLFLGSMTLVLLTVAALRTAALPVL